MAQNCSRWGRFLIYLHTVTHARILYSRMDKVCWLFSLFMPTLQTSENIQHQFHHKNLLPSTQFFLFAEYFHRPIQRGSGYPNMPFAVAYWYRRTIYGEQIHLFKTEKVKSWLNLHPITHSNMPYPNYKDLLVQSSISVFASVRLGSDRITTTRLIIYDFLERICPVTWK